MRPASAESGLVQPLSDKRDDYEVILPASQAVRTNHGGMFSRLARGEGVYTHRRVRWPIRKIVIILDGRTMSTYPQESGVCST